MTNTVTGLVLIVDDVPTNLDVICEALNDAGFDVAIATSGERALQQVELEQPDLVLLDIMMPGIDGFETCQRLKANPLTADIPIIFITALADTDSKVKALEMGAVDYVTKPFHEKEVLARVKTHLQLYQLTQRLEQEVDKKTAELQFSQLRLIQSEKMSALGNLVSGVAHEVNNPIGFLKGSIHNAKEYVIDLLGHLKLYQRLYPHPMELLQENAEEIDLEFLKEDLPKLLDAMEGATDRIKDISTSLRTFSRSDTEQKVSADIHDGIDSTLLILKYRLKGNEYRPAIKVNKYYGEIPEIECFIGQLNQVFMNILANAIDIFDEMAQGRSTNENFSQPFCITLTTEVGDNQVKIRIQDNGKGMPEEVRERIFDHLFTTKGVGEGTGLGLTIARQIVEDKHGGRLLCDSKPGQGTEFCICLPIAA